MCVGVDRTYFKRPVLTSSPRIRHVGFAVPQVMPRRGSRSTIGSANAARKAPDYAVVKRVQRGEGFGTIAGCEFDEAAKTYVHSVDFEQEPVELAPLLH